SCQRLGGHAEVDRGSHDRAQECDAQAQPHRRQSARRAQPPAGGGRSRACARQDRDARVLESEVKRRPRGLGASGHARRWLERHGRRARGARHSGRPVRADHRSSARLSDSYDSDRQPARRRQHPDRAHRRVLAGAGRARSSSRQRLRGPSPYTRRSMTVEALAQHMERPVGRGHTPAQACTGAAGGAACGDLIRISVEVDSDSPEGRIADAGFDASGCGTAVAAGSATIELISGRSLLEAACVGAPQIAAELGGLSGAKHHAAELAADALHRALGWAARTQAKLEPSPERTLVAMSGGVDSAVAALLVTEAGQESVAVTLELWSDPENDGERSCCSAQAVRSARDTAHGMGMAHFSIDLREEFKAGVVDGWLEGYAAGLTPNPCVRCNGSVRLDAMLGLADRLGASALATGHYARVWHAGDALPEAPKSIEEDAASLASAVSSNGAPLLRMAVDEGKDQSYALAALSPRSLARLRFPLGGLTKPEVRERASRAGLEVAHRPDSQDLCFLAGTNSADFLARHSGLKRREGAILDRDGRELGRHEGVHTVTVGQRR